MTVVRPVAVAPGVESFPTLTPTLPPATHTNSYALGERDVVLVEPATPFADELAEFAAFARALVSQGRRLVALFATHHHHDHVGGARELARELGLPLWAHAETARRLHDTPVARTLADGDTLDLDGPTPQRWQVLHTPGHAPGHLCLFERTSGTLVVGDMVASVGTILIEPRDGDMRVYLEQLARLEGLDATVALPAHGAPIREPGTLLRAYQAHRLMREGWIQQAVDAAGPAGGTLDELVLVAYSDVKPEVRPIARLSLEAHLIKLEHDGAVTRRGERWVPKSK
ncbi:MAG: MBL fold metallo-hydrolase [Polyangiaceae bacterium]